MSESNIKEFDGNLEDNKNNISDQGELGLIFHKQHSATRGLESCWMEGYYYASIGQEESQNPFELDTIEYKYYSDGWWSGFYKEEAMFPDHSFDPVVSDEPINDMLDIDNSVVVDDLVDNLIDDDLIAAKNINPNINKDNPVKEDHIKVAAEDDKSRPNFSKSTGILAGIGVAASVIAVLGVTLLDAA
jgi:hypothetical protein